MERVKQKRIVVTCRAMQCACVAVALGFICGVGWGLLNAGEHLQAWADNRGLIVVSGDFSQVQWTLLWILVAIPLVVVCYGLFRLYALFQLFASKTYFTPLAVRHLLAFSLALFAAVVVGMLSNTALSLVVTWSNPEGLRAFNVSFGSHELLLLLFAAVFTVIAWIFSEAILLAEENAEII